MPGPEGGGARLKGGTAGLHQQIAAAVATEVGEEQGLLAERLQGPRLGFGEPLPPRRQIALLQRQQPQPLLVLAIAAQQRQARAIAQGHHVGDAGEHRAEGPPATIAPLQLHLFPAGYGHHRQ